MFLADINQERVIGRLCSGCGNRRVGEWFERERQELSRGGGDSPQENFENYRTPQMRFPAI